MKRTTKNLNIYNLSLIHIWFLYKNEHIQKNMFIINTKTLVDWSLVLH